MSGRAQDEGSGIEPLEGIGDPVAWHEAECGAYRADIAEWTRLCGSYAGPVLELGAGIGRVSLALARAGLDVTGLDADPRLLAEMEERADSVALSVGKIEGWLPEVELGRERFGLIIAPMQFIHLLDEPGRHRTLQRIAEALRPGGAFAAALLDEIPERSGPTELLPDIRDVGGWVHSSLPTEIKVSSERIEVHRKRQLVSPAGELLEEPNVVRLSTLDADLLERELEDLVGLRIQPRISIEPTSDHVGSVLVIAEKRPSRTATAAGAAG